ETHKRQRLLRMLLHPQSPVRKQFMSEDHPMINTEKLKPILEGYKAYFPQHWEDEKYKWEAVQHFQDHWDIEAENFGDMFKQATEKTFNLLASGYSYPRTMITNFA